MDLKLANKTGLVVAGSKGLGRAIAEAWAAEGVSVAVLARSREALDKLQQDVEASGAPGKIIGIEADLTDVSSLDAAVAKAMDVLGAIDLLLLNTGGPPAGKSLNVPHELWEATYRDIVLSLIRLTEAVLPGMRDRSFGRILYIGSPGIISPIPYVAMAQSMRSAMASWLKTLASEVGADGVTVNTIIPGMIETERMWSLAKKRAEMDGITHEEHVKETIKDVPVGRMGNPAEFAAVAAFLASPLASYVTGSLVRVDGGWIRAL